MLVTLIIFNAASSIAIVPQKPSRRSPFDIPGLDKDITRGDIIEALDDSRERRI